MKQGSRNQTVLAAICLLVLATLGNAQDRPDPKEVFKGKLFAPQLILEHRDELELTRDQFTAIREAVVEVQSGVAGFEWDMREAYLAVLEELDRTPVDTDKVMANVEKALLAENEVKKLQVAMLVRLRNLLTESQVDYLKTVVGP